MAEEPIEELAPPELPDEPIEEGTERQQTQQPSAIDQAQNLKDTADQVKDLHGQIKGKLGSKETEKVGQAGLKGIEKETASKAERKVVARGVQQAGQAAARTAATTGAEVGAEAAAGMAVGEAAGVGAAAASGAAAGSVAPGVGTLIGAVVGIVAANAKSIGRWVKKSGWKWIAFPVAILFLLIAIPFALLAGKELPQYPSTTAQKAEATAVAAFSGSAPARNTLIFSTISAERTRMSAFKGWVSTVYGSNSGKASGVTSRIQDVTTLLDQLQITKVPADQQKIVGQIQDKLSSFATDFPELIGYGAVHGYPLTVPGVLEAKNGDCGAASTASVALYFHDRPADLLTATRKGNRANSVCGFPGYLNSHSPYHDWGQATASQCSLDCVKRSLAAGTPVIVYTKPGAIYGWHAGQFNGQHIVVIVGYDPADKTFYINNPGVNRVVLATKTPNGRQMTEAHLTQFLGGTPGGPAYSYPYSFAYVVRKAYW